MIKSGVRSDNRTFFGVKANPFVFIPALIIVSILIISTLVIGAPMAAWFKEVQQSISSRFGFVFIFLLNFLLLFGLWLGFGKYSNVRIGGPGATPDFSLTSWFAMLFSAGMGIGLLFWSVAEPVNHYASNPMITADATDMAKSDSAMEFTFLHWGIHVWALYAVVGLALAYFTFNHKLPLTIRSVFYPILKDRIHGKWGDAIDVLSVVATLFGLATSLGLGVQQINAGLTYLFGVDDSVYTQILLIVLITAAATGSLIFGLDKGIRVLSEWNMRLALALLVFMLVIGPTLYIFNSFFINIWNYLADFIRLSAGSYGYAVEEGSEAWQNGWTVFYWAWWISWSPFVGIFIARISKGRTFKEFMTGVILVPSLLTFLWMNVFGGSAIFLMQSGNTDINNAVSANIATSIYYLLEQYPWVSVSSGLTIVLVAGFFITSSDSGSFVVDTLTSGGRHDAPKGQKIFWASTEGLIAAVLLLGGGLTALQTASLLTGLPFALLLFILVFSFYKMLKEHEG